MNTLLQGGWDEALLDYTQFTDNTIISRWITDGTSVQAGTRRPGVFSHFRVTSVHDVRMSSVTSRLHNKN